LALNRYKKNLLLISFLSFTLKKYLFNHLSVTRTNDSVSAEDDSLGPKQYKNRLEVALYDFSDFLREAYNSQF